MTTCVQLLSNSHCRSLFNSALKVPNFRSSTFGSSSAAPVITHTFSTFFATSIPAQRSTTAFMLSLLALMGRRFLRDVLPRALVGAGRGFMYAGRPSFVYGQIPQYQLRPSSINTAILRHKCLCRKCLCRTFSWARVKDHHRVSLGKRWRKASRGFAPVVSVEPHANEVSATSHWSL